MKSASPKKLPKSLCQKALLQWGPSDSQHLLSQDFIIENSFFFSKGLSKAFSRPLKVGPGQQEEGPLKELAKSLFNVAPDADLTRAQLTSVRRLYLEAGI